MPRLLRFDLEKHCYFITTTTLNRVPIFANKRYADILLNAIYYLRREQRFYLLGFVIMPDHPHILIVPRGQHFISKIMQSIKGNVSWMINRERGSKGSLWQHQFYDHIIRNEDELMATLSYIHNNPVQAGLVERAEDYKYSSANPEMETDLDMWV